MNICVSGPDSCGKSTYIEKCIKKFNMSTIHSTAKTRNDLAYHLDLLDYHDNTCFDRFSVGERVFPYIYNREPKLTYDEFIKTLERVRDNNDMYVLFVCSDVSILKERLIARGELNYLDEIDDQIYYYNKVRKEMEIFFKDYKYFYVCDVAVPGEYDRLDAWTEENFGRTNVNVVYKKLCKDLYENGRTIGSQNIRGGTRELCNYQFTVNDLDYPFVSLETGKTNLAYVAAELLWYWSARNDVSFIGKFANLWNKLTDDGVTNNSAYGYILQKKHGFNQIEKIIELLKKDKNSRRAVLNINVPNENVITTKDEPCTIGMVYQIRDDKLHCTTIMRSNDANFGLRNDLPFFITLQKYIASEVGVEAGSYTHFGCSMHFYDRDTSFIKDVAYGTMQTVKEHIDVDKLLKDKDFIIDYVDNHFESKDEFAKMLVDRHIIY